MGLAQAGGVLTAGELAAVAGEQPAGLAAGGQVVFRALNNTVLRIACGDPATLPFGWVNDADYVQGSPAYVSYTEAIDLSTAANPAPQSVYQSLRYAPGNVSFIVKGLHPQNAYIIRLHWMEPLSEVRSLTVLSGSFTSPPLNIYTLTGGFFRAYSYDTALIIADGGGGFGVNVEGGAGPTSAFLCGMEILPSP